MQRADDVSQSCTLETHVVLLTTVTPIDSIKFFLKEKHEFWIHTNLGLNLQLCTCDMEQVNPPVFGFLSCAAGDLMPGA